MNHFVQTKVCKSQDDVCYDFNQSKSSLSFLPCYVSIVIDSKDEDRFFLKQIKFDNKESLIERKQECEKGIWC